MESGDVQRRLAAILSADAVGYSRLMAQDESGTIRTVTAHRKAMVHCIERERGRVVDAPGDNVLAEFPTALEALRCAVEIQGVLAQRNAELPAERRMPFRIGVHLGDVAAEGERIYGDGVNVAARMEALAEPGGILISDLILRQVRGKLDASFQDLGEKDLKNIPDPVRVYGVRVGSAAAETTEAGGRRVGRGLAIGGAVLALAGLLLWAAWPRLTGLAIDAAGLSVPEHPPLPDKPSIVVLPFENMSGDPEQEYFSDGLSEDLTTQLSLNRMLFVISRNSAFTYKGQAVRVEDVGRELGVRYVLEGSVRRSGERVRVTAQLIDATTGYHLWSKRYDKEMADIFTLQDEISEQIFAAVGVEISDAEQRRVRRKPTEDLNAYEAFQKGLWHFGRFTRADMDKARRWLERAIELDPNYARALSQLGATYTASMAVGWPVEPDALDRALELALRAQELDPALAYPYITRAGVHLNRGGSRTQGDRDDPGRAFRIPLPGLCAPPAAGVHRGPGGVPDDHPPQPARLGGCADEGRARRRPIPVGARGGGRGALGEGPRGQSRPRHLQDSACRALRAGGSAPGGRRDRARDPGRESGADGRGRREPRLRRPRGRKDRRTRRGPAQGRPALSCPGRAPCERPAGAAGRCANRGGRRWAWSRESTRWSPGAARGSATALLSACSSRELPGC
jgi:adenylate cyclase